MAGKESELSELKIRIDEIHTAADLEARSRGEMKTHYQKRIRENEVRLEKYKRSVIERSSVLQPLE